MFDPALSIDFTKAALASGITFARALNTATRVNSSGLIEAANADAPRFDFDPITLACKGLLVEESRANLLVQSSNFTSTFYTASGSSVAGDVVASPSNVTDADFLKEDGANSTHFITRTATVAVASGAAYTFSLFAKANGRNFIRLNFQAGANLRAYFNLATGVVSSTDAGVTATITPFANGFYRCTLTATSAATAAVLQVHLASADGTVVYQGDNTSGVYLWGAQLEAGVFPTSYIPTAASALTRNADVATITGTNFNDWWREGKGSALVRARPGTVIGTRPWVQFDDATADNIIAMRGNAANPELYVRNGGVDQAQIDAGTIAANTRYHLAGAWAINDCATSLNSGAPVLDGVATIPVVTQARLGSDGTNYLNGHLEAIEYYDERVLNASLQVVSSTAGYRSIIGPVFRDSIIS